MSNQFAMSFPALDGGIVMQGHADYCAANGHATHTVTDLEGNVTVSERCPRCGDLTTPATAPTATDRPKETEGFKAMKAQGVEFTSKSFPAEDRGKLFVSFKTETIAAEIAAQLTADGFDVTACPNPAWLKIVGTWS